MKTRAVAGVVDRHEQPSPDRQPAGLDDAGSAKVKSGTKSISPMPAPEVSPGRPRGQPQAQPEASLRSPEVWSGQLRAQPLDADAHALSYSFAHRATLTGLPVRNGPHRVARRVLALHELHHVDAVALLRRQQRGATQAVGDACRRAAFAEDPAPGQHRVRRWGRSSWAAISAAAASSWRPRTACASACRGVRACLFNTTSGAGRTPPIVPTTSRPHAELCGRRRC